ncbi:MAG: hypothetical protein ABIS27_01315, partial [Longimicrobiales bacterium]
EDRPLLRRPAHQASLTASARPARALSTSATLIYTGERDDLNFTDPSNYAGSRVILDSHVTIDASASYRMPARLAGAQLLVRVSNLLDERYFEVFNFPAAGRVVWAGVSIELR